MTNFPRTVLPSGATMPTFPGGLDSWGLSGKGQFRSTLQVGRVWRETWPKLKGDNEDVREFIALINSYWRNRTAFEIAHLSLGLLGAGGGTPLIKGASQTGSSITIDGCPFTTTGWLKAGDLVKINGLNYVYDITADVDSDGAGNATMAISPPIFSGGSPADNAPITITSSVTFTAIITDITMPEGRPPHDYFGLEIEFRETG